MSLETLEASATGFLANIPNPSPEDIRRVLATMLQLLPALKESIDDEQLERAAKRLEAKLVISMTDASKIQLPFHEWLPERRSSQSLYYYPRYRQWLEQVKGFAPSVLGVLDKDSDKIVGLFEDPERLGVWKRRGLVVGHVQSGKTANYTGVICKAADYGYRFIVLLTGIQENLRVQTQERIEEGFIGLNSEATASIDAWKAKTGVGIFDLQRRPMSLTSRDSDFSISRATLPVSLQAIKEPVILVMKKNVNILKNLIEWLRNNSQDSGGRIAGIPMLLIDDEADNASINTAADATSPTSINGRLRELLSLFDRNTYVGYTATPFANIFIDPESVDAMKREDLFPRDFIVSLDAPTNYVGPERIFMPDGDLRYTLEVISDHALALPEGHKISFEPESLPDSLLEAVQSFVLARALRIARGHDTAHSSMLVNVSRFNSVQGKLTGLISDFLNRLRHSCHGHALLPLQDALRDPQLRELKEVWDDRYEAHVSERWADVQRLLARAIGPIEVRTINSRSADRLDYRKYKERGLHVIAIGGLSLSRGFTLEGLTVSYFLRNSIMYDTLLQMGRWFGYRDGYDDICRIYMTSDAISWYEHICEATEELRDEFRRMERAGRRPEDFGLRVRSHPDSLIVTARNKMRAGRVVKHLVSLGGRLIETTALRADSMESNKRTLDQLVAKLDAAVGTATRETLGYVWSRVPAAVVKDFIRGFRNHDDASMKTQADPVTTYITAREDDELAMWDVCLYSPREGDEAEASVPPYTVRPQFRSAELRTPIGGAQYLAVSGGASRVASRGAERAGMSEAEIEAAKASFTARNASSVTARKNISDKDYREFRSRPLLMLHLLRLEYELDKEKHVLEKVVAWGISFPFSELIGTEVEYVVNTRWWNENFGDDLEEYAEEAADGT
jgi:hypothetical protein